MSDIDLVPRGLEGWLGLADIDVVNGQLASRQQLATAVLVSLFTWRRANKDDQLPIGMTDRYGWWGDNLSDIEGDKIGSRLWLLYREKITIATMLRAKQYAEEALNWLVEDKVADKVEVRVSRLQTSNIWTIALEVDVVQPNSNKETFRFSDLWNQIRMGA